MPYANRRPYMLSLHSTDGLEVFGCACLTCDFELGRDIRGACRLLWWFVLRGLHHRVSFCAATLLLTAGRKSLVSTLFVKCGMHSQCVISVFELTTHASMLTDSPIGCCQKLGWCGVQLGNIHCGRLHIQRQYCSKSNSSRISSATLVVAVCKSTTVY